MLTLLKKEINSFLNSLIGYIVICVFLTSIGLFMWVFPSSGSNFNVLDAGYANIDTLFIIAPWVFLFLVPAITMRSFSEEKKNGTLEILFTSPVTDWQIILSKYLAGFILVIFSLLPTLVYYFSVRDLGNPPGNVDTGGMWGSYIGLLFLASGFVAIGIFASSLTDNQIIAFLVAVFFSFFCYIGFESVASFDFFGTWDALIIKAGMNDHYISMSRGVIDTRDIIYFLSVASVFLFMTKAVLESRKW